MTITGAQTHRLAALIQELRPEWDASGIGKAILAAADRGTAWEVAHAALYAAADTTNRTPGVIPLAGAHWSRGRELASTAAVPERNDARCEEHPWARARGCPACRSEALEATNQTRTLVAQHVPPEKIRQILTDAGVTDVRKRAAGERDE
jgi:hypothetical protein